MTAAMERRASMGQAGRSASVCIIHVSMAGWRMTFHAGPRFTS
jgi:hypothetical protein